MWSQSTSCTIVIVFCFFFLFFFSFCFVLLSKALSARDEFAPAFLTYNNKSNSAFEGNFSSLWYYILVHLCLSDYDLLDSNVAVHFVTEAITSNICSG